MLKINVGFLNLVLASSVVAFSAPIAHADSVKARPEAAAGCIPKVSLPRANAVIERFNLDHVNATKEEIQSLGTALVWIEKLNGGEPLAIAVANDDDGYTFKFISEMGASQQMANAIMVRRNGEKRNGENVAQLVHELGHFIGNRGVYGDYRAATQGAYCMVSSYSDDKANEQFAEAFAAFVTVPDLMKAIDSPGCRRAYAYFKTRLFANGALADKCAAGALQAGVDY
ncbi:MAG: hypothetical protein V4760_16465 [Bdellovibrionota bacterium]